MAVASVRVLAVNAAATTAGEVGTACAPNPVVAVARAPTA